MRDSRFEELRREKKKKLKEREEEGKKKRFGEKEGGLRKEKERATQMETESFRNSAHPRAHFTRWQPSRRIELYKDRLTDE